MCKARKKSLTSDGKYVKTSSSIRTDIRAGLICKRTIVANSEGDRQQVKNLNFLHFEHTLPCPGACDVINVRVTLESKFGYSCHLN